MRPKTIGIIGGAGPLAGATLLNRILSLSASKYGCYKDADFPKILLISFPFSEMLTSDSNATQLRKELEECLLQLRSQGAAILGIACNTLHAFLDEKQCVDGLVHLPQTTARALNSLEKPLVFCTSTSMRHGLHQQFFPCIYPDAQTQDQVDEVIDLILRGCDQKKVVKKLRTLIQAQTTHTIVLGCTELSLLFPYIQSAEKTIIDPLEIMANQIVEKSFKENIGPL